VRKDVRNILAFENNLPLLGREYAHDRIKDCRFTRSIGTNNRDELPLLNVKTHTANRLDITIADMNIVDFK
jgi:hypothetical protein